MDTDLNCENSQKMQQIRTVGWKIGAGRLVLLLFALTAQTVATAAARQTPESILTAARQFLVEQVGHGDGKLRIEMSRIDPRLRLPLCVDGMRVEAPQRGNLLGKISLHITCKEAVNHKPWSIFVGASVSLMQSVYVARGYIPRGTEVTLDQVQIGERDVTRMRGGFFERPEQIEGMIARQTIAPGQVLNTYALKPPTLVKRGQTIAIVARQGDLVVRMKGLALGNGAAGDRIQVKNTTSKRVVEGLVTPEGEVSVPL